jgi:integrase
VPLTHQAARIVKALRQARDIHGHLGTDCADRIFPFGAPMVRSAFERVRTRANILGLRFHDLRREGVTRFIERGLNLI